MNERLIKKFKEITECDILITEHENDNTVEFEAIVENHWIIRLFVLKYPEQVEEDLIFLMAIDALFYKVEQLIDTKNVSRETYKEKIVENFNKGIDKYPRI